MASKDCKPYASIQAIREGAGLLSRVNNETPVGTVDGTNRAFAVKRRPIVDQNYDDVVGPEDVSFYIDGTNVAVEAVDPKAGVITLVEAPSSGRPTCDYAFSGITDEYVTTKQAEANSWVDLKIKRLINTPLQNPPGIITTIAELYAAGLILTRDWGNRSDTELTSKDGYAKIKQARDLIADYLQGLEDDRKRRDTNGANDVSVASGPEPFGRYPHELGNSRPDDITTDDEWFNHHQ